MNFNAVNKAPFDGIFESMRTFDGLVLKSFGECLVFLVEGECLV